MDVTLRAIETEDLPLLRGGESEFDDFGPRAAAPDLPPPDLGDRGGLTVLCDGDVVGHVSWHPAGWGPGAASRCPNIGIWLAPDARGRGIGRIAQAQLATLMFTHTTVNRVEATTDVDNVAEQRALEGAGFTREGVIRGAQWRGGAYHDMVEYSILRGDPRPAL